MFLIFFTPEFFQEISKFQFNRSSKIANLFKKLSFPHSESDFIREIPLGL
jgi:hypothetical protein